MNRPKKLSFTTKKIIGVAVISIPFSFFSYMGILTVIRGSKTFDKLNHVQGQVTDVRQIKHKYSTKFKTVYKDVLVLSVDGTSDEFGFMEGNDAYEKLSSFREIGKTAEVYYDGSGKRIEQGVTLHTFDLKIENYQVVNIADIKRSERVGSILFISGALILLIIAIAVIRKKDQPQSNDAIAIDDDE